MLKSRYTLLTLLLCIAIAALVASHVAMWRKVQHAQSKMNVALAEVETARRQFGYLDIDDPKLIHITGIASQQNCCRMYVPPGHRFLLHVTETVFPTSAYPDNPEPSASLSMNSWSEGADVVLRWSIEKREGKRRLVARTDSENLFDYELKEFKQGPAPNSMSRIAMNSQKTFQPDETIRFMHFINESTRTGVMLWMEPTSNRYPR